MDRTPVSLLEQLRQPSAAEAWPRFVQLYTPLLYHWMHRLGVPNQDTDDLVQSVFVILVQELPRFDYDPSKKFRAWLWTIIRNKWREQKRRQAAVPQQSTDATLDDCAGPDPVDGLAETEYRQYLVGRALRLMQADFQPSTWQACWDLLADKPAERVASDLGLSLDAVYTAKSRVLRRLRQELAGLLD
jgi:RNA polymerase sigma-70 factor (ECF subfamily)